MYTRTMGRVQVPVVAVEKQYILHILGVFFQSSTISLRTKQLDRAYLYVIAVCKQYLDRAYLYVIAVCKQYLDRAYLYVIAVCKQ